MSHHIFFAQAPLKRIAMTHRRNAPRVYAHSFENVSEGPLLTGFGCLPTVQTEWLDLEPHVPFEEEEVDED